MALRITVSDDDNELALFAGKSGYASIYYGSHGFIVHTLIGCDRFDTADWLSDETEEKVAWLNAIEVTSGKRGKGVGSALLRRALRELEKRKVGLVFLHAMADYGYAEKLGSWYEAHGFSLVGEVDEMPLYSQYLDGD